MVYFDNYCRNVVGSCDVDFNLSFDWEREGVRNFWPTDSKSSFVLGNSDWKNRSSIGDCTLFDVLYDVFGNNVFPPAAKRLCFSIVDFHCNRIVIDCRSRVVYIFDLQNTATGNFERNDLYDACNAAVGIYISDWGYACLLAVWNIFEPCKIFYGSDEKYLFKGNGRAGCCRKPGSSDLYFCVDANSGK